MSLTITSGHLAGIIVTLAGVTLVGLYAGRRVKSATSAILKYSLRLFSSR
jgi:hypothetical protein